MSLTSEEMIKEEIIKIIDSKNSLLSGKKIISLAEEGGELSKISTQKIAHILKAMYENGLIGMVQIESGNRYCKKDLENKLKIKHYLVTIKEHIWFLLNSSAEPASFSKIFEYLNQNTNIKFETEDVKNLLSDLCKNNEIEIVQQTEQDESNNKETFYTLASKKRLSTKNKKSKRHGRKLKFLPLISLVFVCSILGTAVIAFLSSLMATLIDGLILGGLLYDGFDVAVSTDTQVMVTIISSGITALILTIIAMSLIIYFFAPPRAYGSEFWTDREMKVWTALLSLLPEAILGGGLMFLFVKNFDTFASRITPIANLELSETQNSLIHIGGVNACAVTLILTTLFMIGLFFSLSCPKCRMIGGMSYNSIGSQTKNRIAFKDHTNREKIASIKCDGIEVGRIDADVTRTDVYNVKETTTTYSGCCYFCGGGTKFNETEKEKTQIY